MPNHKSPVLSLLIAGALSCAPLFAATATTVASVPLALEIDASAKGKAISPDLFGIFIEDLNYTADGGLYAELIENRSFEYAASEKIAWNSLTGWTTQERGGAKGFVGVRAGKPLHANNPHYISLDVKVPGEGFGVSNSGIEGIPVVGGDSYDLSFFAHQMFMGAPWTPDNGIVGRPMPVVVRLEAADGSVLAEAQLEIAGYEWKKRSVTLVPSRSETKARLVVLAKAQGGLALDEISLFPQKTFKGRKNGLRADLAQVVADLKPKFVRFPGGCLAHGDGLDNIYNWKNTVGPLEQRRGQRNLWQYHQSMGLGYYEYFQFCEDIGAKPLPVVPAGVSCQNSAYMPGHGQQAMTDEQLKVYIQDVLDLIEWANGPVTSKWGKVRADAGHPAPFGMKYLGLGNEDQITPDFERCYKAIQDVLRERHPEIVVIGTTGPFPAGEDFEKGWAYARKLNVQAVDEHYYCEPEWFWKNLTRYDSYDRNGPKVYVGEYAAHEKDRRNTLRTALAEAAACTGFERNGDIVILSSYAPLLARRGNTQWTPDMIYFTATEVYPSINYEVQRLVSVNSGDAVLPTRETGVPAGARLAWSAVTDSASGDIIIKVVNGGEAPLTAKLALGLPAGRSLSLKATVLTGPSADIAREDGKPSPTTLTQDEAKIDATFERTFPANSLTVLRVR